MTTWIGGKSKVGVAVNANGILQISRVDDNRSATAVYGVGGAISIINGTVLFWAISGVSGYLLRVHRLAAYGFTPTSVGYNSIVLEKWAGWPTPSPGSAPVTLDTAASVVRPAIHCLYSAAPTEAQLIGTMGVRRILLQSFTAAAGARQPEAVWEFRDGGEASPPLLRGTEEVVSLAMFAAPGSSPPITVECTWSMKKEAA